MSISAMIRFTAAPTITVDQERREQERLSDIEKLKITSDLLGIDILGDETGSMAVPAKVIKKPSRKIIEGLDTSLHRESSSRHLNGSCTFDGNTSFSSLSSSSSETTLYVDRSDFVHFLHHTDYNPEKAASLIMKYSDTRLKIFGETANLPMTMDQTNSALSHDDISLLKKCAFQFLPNDSHGRTVLFYNKAMYIPSQHTPQNLTRCLFYMLTLALKKESTVQKGLVLVGNFKYYDVSQFHRRWTREAVRLVTSCFPIKVAGIHVCYATKQSSIELIMPAVKYLLGADLRHRLRIHIGGDQHIQEQLNTFGIKQLHESLGGKITNQNVQEHE